MRRTILVGFALGLALTAGCAKTTAPGRGGGSSESGSADRPGGIRWTAVELATHVTGRQPQALKRVKKGRLDVGDEFVDRATGDTYRINVESQEVQSYW
ncbi:MAG: hypothetical protein HY876_07715 [Coriobacteriales bacterium]|nr:hypothetical protein [Coriobacteriales bacterium]